MVMMLCGGECTAVPSLVALQEARDARHGGRAGAGALCDVTVRPACSDLLRDFPSLAPFLELGECADIAEKRRDLALILARSKHSAEGLEPGVRSPVAFGEALLGHG